jgi:RHS repeat-associated protein
MQLAFAEAVIEIAASDWGGTSASLDDGGGGQTPTPSALPINNPDMFSMQLIYADGHAMVNSPIQKNGNISGMIWQTPGRNTQSYSFEYDEINRLKNAYHQDVISGGQLSTDNKYGVEITYDKVGNINTLNRRGVIDICPTPTPTFEYGPMDALSYNYVEDGGQTNRLQSIEEFANVDHGFKSEGGDYSYDGFGNMITDAKTGATIDYNHLNLPKRISVSEEGSIEFTYDAAGIKLKKVVSETAGGPVSTMYYIGGIEYKDNKMESIQHAEGRITFHEDPDTGDEKPLYEYFLKDHLGNVRVTLADKDGDGYIEPFNVNPDEKNLGGTSDASVDLTDTEVYQETHYYPFGMTMEGEWQNIVNGPENNYLYNGKELNSDFGLDWSDYGARYYDAAIGRWGQVDPLAETMASWSPYNYGFNDPISFTDPDGKAPVVPLILGGISAGFEYGSQVYGNYSNGDGYYDMFVGNVDIFDVGVEFLAGASGSKFYADPLVEGAKASLDVEFKRDGVNVSHIGDGTQGKAPLEVLETTAKNTVISYIGGKVENGMIEGFSDAAVKKANSNVFAANKNYRKAKNKSGNNTGKGVGTDPKVYRRDQELSGAKGAQGRTWMGNDLNLHNPYMARTGSELTKTQVNAITDFIKSNCTDECQ